MIDLIVSPLLLPGDLLIVPKRHFMAPALERAKSFSRPPQQSVTVRRKRWSLSKVGCIKQTAAVSNIAAHGAWQDMCVKTKHLVVEVSKQRTVAGWEGTPSLA